MRSLIIKMLVLTWLFAVIIAAPVFSEETQPLTLKELCRIALQKNPSLSEANASVVESEAMLRKTRGAMLPTLAVESRYSYVSKPTFFGTTPILEKDTMINRVEIQQPIFNGGQMQSMAGMAKWTLQAKLRAESAVKSFVLANVAIAYYNAKKAYEFIAVANASVKHLESGFESANKLYKAGVVTKSDMLRIEVALAGAKDQSIKAKNDYASAVAVLKSITGMSQEEEIKISDLNDEEWLKESDKLPSGKRSELESADFAVKAAKARLRAAAGMYQPGIFLTADYENQPKGAQFPRRTDTFGVGIVARLNIYDGGQTQATIDMAKAAVARAEAEYRKIKQETDLQLVTAQNEVVSARSRVESLKTQVASAEETLRLNQIGYREGVYNLTELLLAESVLTNAKATSIAADFDLKIAGINLLLAKGQAEALVK
ncbi:MAG: TolC family protein [Firmicutes bacterium]|nr:TolC family protein [Bacillota bacterium]